MTHVQQIPLSNSALIIIDMQKAYFKPEELNRQQKSLTSGCNRLIAAYREAKRPIYFIRTAHSKHGDTWTLNMHDDKQGYLFDGTNDVELLDGLDTRESDVTITKLRDSAFYATIFEQILREHHIDTLVLAGVSTQTCVGQTAADAYARNLRVVLVDDAIGTHDKTYHEPTLTMLAKEYRQCRAHVADVKAWLEPPASRKDDA